VNKDNTILYGPVKKSAIPDNGYFLTDIIPGDCVTLFLFEPYEQRDECSLCIKKVVHGYRGVFSSIQYDQTGTSDTCNNDVACFPEYEKESNAVALVLLENGDMLCSGSLLITSDLSFKPYFLTAFHCIDGDNNGSLSVSEKESAQKWLFLFQYKKTTCDGISHSNGISYNGDYFRSAWYQTDFALLELKQDLSSNKSLTWLGWDRSGQIPTSGTGIHHPSGDLMKISFDYDQFSSCSYGGGTDNFWLLNYDDGVVEHGSSGSPILNESKHVVGQLHGNRYYSVLEPYCNQPRAEYGKFNLSWSGAGHDDDRLSNWLDSLGLGQTTMESSHSIYISEGNYIQAPTAFHVVNLPSDYSVIWSLSGYVAAFLQVQQNSPSSNQCTLSFRSGDHDSATGKLIANIYKGSTLIRTLSKDIFVLNHLYVTYRQDACSYYGVSHPAIPTTQMNPNQFYFVHQGCTVTLSCSYFKYFDLSWGSGYQPTDYYFYDNYVTFVLPLGSGGIPCYLNLKNDLGQTCFQLKFFSVTGNGNLASNSIILQQTGHLLNVSLVDAKSNNHQETKKIYSSNSNIHQWSIEIYDGITAEKKLEEEVSGSSCIVDVSSLKKGFYIIRAVVGDEILNEKINIK
jgi:hypothetical protein